MTEEKIPPLPKIAVSGIDKKYVTQETLDRALQIIYERRPDFFKRSYERDKSWKEQPDHTVEEEEEWIHDAFSKELHNYIRHEVLKEVGVTDPMMLNMTQGCIFSNVRILAFRMYATPNQNKAL